MPLKWLFGDASSLSSCRRMLNLQSLVGSNVMPLVEKASSGSKLPKVHCPERVLVFSDRNTLPSSPCVSTFCRDRLWIPAFGIQFSKDRYDVCQNRAFSSTTANCNPSGRFILPHEPEKKSNTRASLNSLLKEPRKPKSLDADNVPEESPEMSMAKLCDISRHSPANRRMKANRDEKAFRARPSKAKQRGKPKSSTLADPSVQETGYTLIEKDINSNAASVIGNLKASYNKDKEISRISYPTPALVARLDRFFFEDRKQIPDAHKTEFNKRCNSILLDPSPEKREAAESHLWSLLGNIEQQTPRSMRVGANQGSLRLLENSLIDDYHDELSTSVAIRPSQEYSNPFHDLINAVNEDHMNLKTIFHGSIRNNILLYTWLGQLIDEVEHNVLRSFLLAIYADLKINSIDIQLLAHEYRQCVRLRKVMDSTIESGLPVLYDVNLQAIRYFYKGSGEYLLQEVCGGGSRLRILLSSLRFLQEARERKRSNLSKRTMKFEAEFSMNPTVFGEQRSNIKDMTDIRYELKRMRSETDTIFPLLLNGMRSPQLVLRNIMWTHASIYDHCASIDSYLERFPKYTLGSLRRVARGVFATHQQIRREFTWLECYFIQHYKRNPYLPSTSEIGTGSHGQAISLDPKILEEPQYRYSPPPVRQTGYGGDKTLTTPFWSYEFYRNNRKQIPKIYLSTSKQESDEAIARVLNKSVVGFDMEWMASASARHGVKNNVSLIQISDESQIVLVQLARFPGDDSKEILPQNLKRLVEDRSIIKAGVNIQSDCTRLEKHLGLKAKSIFELGHLHKLVKYSTGPPEKIQLINRKPVALATMVHEHLGLPMAKPMGIRCDRWDNPLSYEQRKYAANDAYACHRLYSVLEQKRKQLKPQPPRPSFAETKAPILLADGSTVEQFCKEHGVVKKSHKTKTQSLRQVKRRDTTVASELGQSEKSLKSSTIAPKWRVPHSRPLSSPNVEALKKIARAKRWARLMFDKLKTRPRPRKRLLNLKTYFLWHFELMDIKNIANILENRPLKDSSVATYICRAIRCGQDIPFDEDRLEDVKNRYLRTKRL